MGYARWRLHEHLMSGEVICSDFSSQYHGFKLPKNYQKKNFFFRAGGYYSVLGRVDAALFENA